MPRELHMCGLPSSLPANMYSPLGLAQDLTATRVDAAPNNR